MKGPKSWAVWPAHVPRWLHPALQWWWPGTRWATDHAGAVHLTFDDGPDPDITPWVLDLLEEHGMTATFFVVGAQAKRHPDLLKKVRAQGHAVGRHAHPHRKYPSHPSSEERWLVPRGRLVAKEDAIGRAPERGDIEARGALPAMLGGEAE